MNWIYLIPATFSLCRFYGAEIQKRRDPAVTKNNKKEVKS